MKKEIDYKRSLIIISLLLVGFILGVFLVYSFAKPTITNIGEGADKYSTLNLEKAFTPTDWIRDGEDVYINDSNVYIRSTAISTTPIIQLQTKQFSGPINIVVGFDTDSVVPTKAESNPHYVDVNKTYVCDYEFNYTLSPKYFWCYQRVWNNQTLQNDTNIIFQHEFDYGNVATKTAIWTEQDLRWDDVSGAFQSKDFEFYGLNKWYYKENFNVVAGQNYYLKLNLQLQGLQPSHKYWIAFYPSSETMEEAILNEHFYALDPWTPDLRTGLVDWYSMNVSLNNITIDDFGRKNGTCKNCNSTNTMVLANGKVGGAFCFNAISTTARITILDDALLDYVHSMCFWYYHNDTSSTTATKTMMGKGNSSDFNHHLNIETNRIGDVVYYDDDTTTQITPGSALLNVNDWNFICFTTNETGMGNNGTLYVNGVHAESEIVDSTYEEFNNDVNFTIGGGDYEARSVLGCFDEVGLWNVTLNATQVVAMNNSPISYTTTDLDSSSPSVTLNSPTDGQTINTPTVTFNGSAFDNVNLVNISLFGNFTGTWLLNQTNSSVVNNSNTYFTNILPNGAYKWNYYACDNSSNCAFATSNYTLNVSVLGDGTIPTIALNLPIDAYNTTSTSIILNCTAFDNIKVQNVSVYLNGGLNQTNSSVLNNSLTSFSFPALSFNTYSWFCGTCDNSSNCANTTARTFNILATTNYSLYYPSSVVEGSDYTYYFNISSTPSLTSSAVNITYNGTVYAMTLDSSNSSFASYKKILTGPTVASDTTLNLSFQYTINGISNSTSNFTQSVINYQSITMSSTLCSDLVYNFTFYDEGNLSNLNFKFDYLINYGEITNTTQYSLYGSFDQESEIHLCMNKSLPVRWYIGYGEFLYSFWANGTYVERRYYFDNGTTLNTTSIVPIYLYGLWRDDATTFEVTYKDSSYIPISGAIIQAQRKYISDNTYKIVEMEKTDSYGKSTFNLDIDAAIYKFIVTKDGITIKEFDDSRIFCANPAIQECKISLNDYQSSIPVTDFEEEIDFSYSVTRNSTSRAINLTYTIPSGTDQYVSINVTKEDSLGTAACSAITYNDDSTIGCIVPSSIGNSTVTVSVYKNGTLIAKSSRSFQQSPSEIYGGIAVILAVFILLTLLGAGISDNPIFTVIFFLIGLILIYALKLVANDGFVYGATILWIIIAIVLVLIKGGKRN